MGSGRVGLYFGVGLELVSNTVAASTERACQGHFGSWVNFRVRRGLPVFFQNCSNGMTHVWHLFEYVA